MFKKIFFIFAALAIFLFSGSQVLAQEEKWWDFGKWAVDININKDSTFVVRETQTFNFHGNFHWTQRDISKNKLRAISDVKVFDENGKELLPPEIEISEDAAQVSVKINFDLVDTQATWTFEYKVIGGLGYFDDHDELYWNAISEDRDVPIKEVEVRVHLPEEASVGDLEQTLYTGPAGSTDSSGNYKIIDGKTFRFWGSDIGAYENFTIVAGWPKEIVFEPGILKINSEPIGAAVILDGQKINLRTPAVLEEKYEISSGEHKISVAKFGWDVKGEEEKTVKVEMGKIDTLDFELKETTWFFALEKLSYLIPILIGIFLFRRYKNIPKIKKTIIAQYDPPKDLLPAEMGGLVYNKVRPKDFTATLIDLAYRGYLKIIEREEKVLWMQTKKYTLVKRKEFASDPGLSDYEKEFLEAIFGAGETVELSDLRDMASKTSFQKMITKLPKEVLEKLVKEKEYFRSMPLAREMSFLLALFAAGIFISMVVVMFPNFSFSMLVAILISLGLWFIYLVIKPPPLTEKGVEVKWHALGFKEYLQVAERFRLGALTPETFEKYLSYAMVFGVERKWAERFADIYKTQPDWYESGTPISGFNSVIFANSLLGMKTSVDSAISYSNPSGSSGFGGGGGAGGGGGGGGSSAG
ncbi:DUF2207 domain-containing protein [Candidatus Falkowbacteria bacterium]|nr:DUF2207 domain-containing protein [Candidatus Falkowbacteria bacterium]